MNTYRPIITVTLNPAVDLSTSVPALIAQRKLRCNAPLHEPGGGGINVARVVRTLGGEATAIFPIGGLTGERLRELVIGCGVAHHAVRVAGETRENLAVEARDTHELYRFVMPGPTLSADEYERILSAVQDEVRRKGQGAMLVISGSLCAGAPDGLFDSLVGHVRGLGGRVFADVSGQHLRHAARAGAAFLKPNRHELEDFAGRALETDDEVSTAAESLRALGDAEAVLVSLGAGGMLAVTREERFLVEAPKVPIASTIGAGDSAVAGVALALSQGRSLEEAVRRGVATGSATCMTPGTNLCTLEDVERIASLMV